MGVFCNITAQYSTDGGASWHAATSGPGGSGTGGLSVTPSGNAYTYVWNSSADLGASLDSNVLFKITPTDAAGFGTPGATAGFAADDRHSPPVIGSLTASPEPVALGGNLTLTASNVVDTDGSVVGVKILSRRQRQRFDRRGRRPVLGDGHAERIDLDLDGGHYRIHSGNRHLYGRRDG